VAAATEVAVGTTSAAGINSNAVGIIIRGDTKEGAVVVDVGITKAVAIRVAINNVEAIKVPVNREASNNNFLQIGTQLVAEKTTEATMPLTSLSMMKPSTTNSTSRTLP